jgi:hypothetical protein
MHPARPATRRSMNYRLRKLSYLQCLPFFCAGRSKAFNIDKERIMGKYFIAWLLGVPGIVLLLLYFFFH